MISKEWRREFIRGARDNQQCFFKQLDYFSFFFYHFFSFSVYTPSSSSLLPLRPSFLVVALSSSSLLARHSLLVIPSSFSLFPPSSFLHYCSFYQESANLVISSNLTKALRPTDQRTDRRIKSLIEMRRRQSQRVSFKNQGSLERVLGTRLSKRHCSWRTLLQRKHKHK